MEFFERLACEEGWQPGDELRAHIDRSVYFALWAARDEGGKAGKPAAAAVVGGMQLVLPDAESGGSLPCQRVWPELDFGGRKGVAHVAVLAVRQDWRARGEMGGLFWLLAAKMWLYCVEAGIKELRLEATPRTLRCYQRLGWPLSIDGPLRLHWGEECYPCSLLVRDVAGELTQRAVRSTAHRRIVAQALGLDPCGINNCISGTADAVLSNGEAMEAACLSAH